MAKAHQDQVNWPYAPSHFYPQPPRRYNIPYAQGRFCQESCCRRTRPPLSYPPSLPPLPPSMPCRPTQDNAYPRPQAQNRGFIPVNPYVQPHPGHPQHAQPAVHRPIPQGRYDYNDFYRYQASANNTNNNNHQGFHSAVLKQNATSYGAPNPPHVPEQYPACSLYTPIEQESAPSLDVRQFLATWQDKDEESFETEQQPKPKMQYQEPTPNTDVFKPLDCTKRNENPLPIFGYNHSQMNSHPAYYNKPLQSVPNHQLLNDGSFKNTSYMSGNSYHPMSLDNDCNYNTTLVNSSPHTIIDNDPQHVGYERRIEKVFNPHGCKGISTGAGADPNLCAVDKVNHNLEMSAPSQGLPEKNQYHLSASLESEDLFDDINRKREERQRNIVHPLCYQELNPQRINGNIRNKTDIPHVNVKPNTAIHMTYPMDNYGTQDVIMDEMRDMDLKKSKSLPLKKWVQKRKKPEDEFFSPFNIVDPNLDFSTRDTVIERSHLQPTCGNDLVMNVNNGNCGSSLPVSGMDHVADDTSSLMHDVPNFGTMNNSEKPAGVCGYEPLNAMSPHEPHSNNLQGFISCPAVSPLKVGLEGSAPMNMCPTNITVAPSTLVAPEEPPKDSSDGIPDYHELIAKTCDEPSTFNETVAEEKEDDVDNNNSQSNSNVVASEVVDEKKIDADCEKPEKPNEQTPCTDKSSSVSSNALTTIAYMYDEMNDENNVSQTSLDSSRSPLRNKTSSASYKRKHKVTKFPILKRNKQFSLLTLWKCRNRLFPRSLTVKPALFRLNGKPRCFRDISKSSPMKKRKIHSHLKNTLGESTTNVNESEAVNGVLSSLVNDVCQIGEISSQACDSNEQSPTQGEADDTLTEDKSTLDSKSKATEGYEDAAHNSPWDSAARDEKVTSTVESDVMEEEDSIHLISGEYVGYTEGSVMDGSDDRVLHGILNWPHHEEEITSINEKESIKVSLPWVKIFKPHCDLPDGEKTLEIGPARVELRYSPAPVEYQPGHYKANRNSFVKKSSVFSVKKVLLKHCISPPTERLPKMVIKKTGCEEYRSYIKDAKLRVISIKNSNKDGQAEVIIEADRPLIESVCPTNNQESSRTESPELRTSGVIEYSESSSEHINSELTPCEEKELHHCLLCQESFTSLEKLRNHENSLTHRHIDIIQRSVLHKLQKSFKGIDFPPFQPLSPSELEYLNWRPNFSGYNHFYHNVPL